MNLLHDVPRKVDPRIVLLSTWRCFAALVLTFSLSTLTAQVDNVMVYGTVKDMSTAKKLDGVTVTVFKNGAKLVDVVTNASGKYEVNLDYGADFKVMCSKPGFVGKNISIDTRNVPEEERQGGHGMNIDFTMMTEIDGVDYSVLLEPFGKANYTAASGNFEWDMEYTNRMRDKQARLLKEYEDRKKREANAEADFAKLMQEGTSAMSASDFKKAVGSFTEALTIKPGDAVATAKLSDARMRLDGQDAEKKLAEQYATLIKDADGLMAKKDYEGARGKFNAALDLKETEAYPKQKIKEIDAILADLAKKAEEDKKNKELQEKYQAAIAAADAAFKAENWDQATTKYTEAGGLKPEEKYPKDQLALIAVKKEEAARKAEEDRKNKELQEKYQAAIAAADAAFKSSNWDVATARYTEASGLKPEEKYPKDQLAAIAVQRDAEAKKAEEDRLAREQEEQYRGIIAAADAAFQSAQYDASKAKYEEALGLRPQEKYPKDQLAAIRLKLDELARKAEEERKAKDLDAQYEGLLQEAATAFTGERYDAALSKYTEASALKPTEQYPKDQIAAIRKKMDDLAKLAEEQERAKELDEKYQAAIDKADQAFGKEKWEDAEVKYTEAAGLKPSEQYPRDQLAAIAARKADLEEARKQAETDARYEALIADADKAFGKSDLQNARAKYQEALTVKPAEAHPKDRIAEIDALIAEQANQAEEERKRQELEARYAALITSADKAFDGEKWSNALNDYKDALDLKPEESHPKDRIALVEQRLDAAAQAKAEEERLAREKQDRDKRYNDLITAADNAFAAKRYDEARTGYSDAVGVKPEEKHPQDRLAEIERILADQARQAEEQRLAAEQEAAERERQAELDRLAAEEAAAEKARRAEEEQRRLAEQEATESRYRELIGQADLAYSAKDWEAARSSYVMARDVKPTAKYPVDRIAAIDAELERQRNALSEADRLAEEQRRAEEERRRLEEEAAEAARLAEEAERLRLENERREREMADSLARASAEERDRLARENARAIEEGYRSAIAAADAAMAEQDYSTARGKYSEASDIKPEESYPLAKIDQIDKLLAELERQRVEAELAAERARQAEAERPTKAGTRIDARKEEEAERFMREAREQEEREKYARIQKFRSNLEEEQLANESDALDRRMGGVEQKEHFQDASAGLYSGDESRRAQNAQEVAAYKAALARAEAERRARAADVRSSSYQGKLTVQEDVAQRDKVWDQRQSRAAQASLERKEELRTAEENRVEAGLASNADAREAVIAQAERRDELERRGANNVDVHRRSVEEEKRAQQTREMAYAQGSELTRNRNKEQLDGLPRDQQRAFADYNRSKLAQEYPPGVTEESYTEGNKVIIRRVVVNGNKADEYSKVIAKWGTFYFKNGQSISEVTWSKETGS